MKIPDLSKINVKDIDSAKIKDMATQHKESLLQGALVLFSVIMTISLCVSSQTEVNKYKAQIAALQSKTGIIEEFNKSQNQVKTFLNEVPRFVSEDKMTTLVTDFAGQMGVKMVTFSPPVIEKKNNIETTAIKFTMAANSFVEMIRFMSEIERGKDFLQIWGCEVESQQDPHGPAPDKKKVPINFRIQVASLKVKT